MESFPRGAEAGREEGAETPEAIAERIAAHSAEWDTEIAVDRRMSPEDVREGWKEEMWRVGDAEVRALGVMHVPETFLEHRKEIEAAIQEADLVVNEFAPEAEGLYDPSQADRLRGISSKFGERYSLEDMRQAFVRYQRPWRLGPFHHEVELLAAKYGKDMAVIDPEYADGERMLQDQTFYMGASELAEKEAKQERTAKYAAAAAIAAGGLASFLKGLDQKKVTRRQFLGAGLMAGAGVLAGAAAKQEIPRAEYPAESSEDAAADIRLTLLRDPVIAERLTKLAGEKGYKKIAFIYGSGHLPFVEKSLSDPGTRAQTLARNEKFLEKEAPDTFRVYRLAEGENRSSEFVASKEKVWKRVE